MSQFICVECGKQAYILNKDSIVSIHISTYSREIEIFMKDNIHHKLTYSKGLEDDFLQAVNLIYKTMFE